MKGDAMAVGEEEFDAPLFKVLAHNDTGQAVGHQSGFVVPKDLEPYFPQLSGNVSAISPTSSVDITVTLFDAAIYLGDVSTRYQYQTWGGTRSPERRMTSNLSGLLNLAQADDILIIERGLLDQGHYRLTLFRHVDPSYLALRASLAGKRWGALNSTNPPVRETSVIKAIAEQAQAEAQPFEAFDMQAQTVEQRTTKIARSKAFQRRLQALYLGRCAMCSTSLTRLDGKTEAEAAHIIPRSVRGSDDARNGLILCRAHHWAFDNGLIGVDDDLKVIVPQITVSIAGNANLALLAGKKLAAPSDPEMAPHIDALRWHRNHFNIH